MRTALLIKLLNFTWLRCPECLGPDPSDYVNFLSLYFRMAAWTYPEVALERNADGLERRYRSVYRLAPRHNSGESKAVCCSVAGVQRRLRQKWHTIRVPPCGNQLGKLIMHYQSSEQ